MPCSNAEQQLRDALTLVGVTRDNERATNALAALIQRANNAESELATARARIQELERVKAFDEGFTRGMIENLSAARARIQELGRVPPLFDLSYMERHGGHYIRVEDHRLSLAEIQRLNGELSAAQAKLAGVGTTHQIVPVEPTPQMRSTYITHEEAMQSDDGEFVKEFDKFYRAMLAASKETR